MSKVAEVAEVAADGVADGMHIVSEEALAAEKVVRGLEGAQIAYIGLGVAIGAVIGGLIAYRKAEIKYIRIADEEIAGMREHYNKKVVALESTASKKNLEEIVQEQGYAPETTEPPMAVTPPTSVVKAAEAARGDAEEETPPPPEVEVPEVQNVFHNAEVEDDWDWHQERARRSPLKPYVIHRDERDEQQAYEGVTFTYYEEDDVLCNERDEVIGVEDRERLIGETNLAKFGHGSGDASVVYVRNDQLEMDIEVVKSPNSYAEEVHGFEPPQEERALRHSHRRERRRIEDE